jgi:hypothetical protein
VDILRALIFLKVVLRLAHVCVRALWWDVDELQQREPAPPSPPPPPPPLSEATMAQAASGRCLPTPSNADQTYTIVRAGVASNDPTTAPTGPVGSSCSDDRRGFVAMVTPCTSRKANFRTVARSPFAKSFLPSAVETLARSVDAGLDVVFYVGYDAGDRVWDTDTARTDTLKLAQKLFDGPTARLLPATISVGFRMVRCNSNNMVAASNCAVEAAYNDGASYWYRLNDDTTMVTPNWLRDMPVLLRIIVSFRSCFANADSSWLLLASICSTGSSMHLKTQLFRVHMVAD